MPKRDGTILVQPIHGEVMRYRVESWEKPKYPHTVDLAMNGGNGACSCKDWETRRGPALAAGATPFTRETQCRHIRAASRYFLVETLKAISEQLDRRPRPLTRTVIGSGVRAPSTTMGSASSEPSWTPTSAE